MTPKFLRAALAGKIHEAEQELAFALPAEWVSAHERLLSLRLEQVEAEPTLQPWLLRAMVLRTEDVFVGHIGFHTAPGADYLQPYSPGAVEFGYTVYPAYRRRGYAREAARALMQWAIEIHGVTKFIQTISPDNHASQALGAQLGFTRIGSHIDDVDGPEDILEYRVPEGD
jgi:ribosomal-protein-alanine N-acetyltransferase